MTDIEYYGKILRVLKMSEDNLPNLAAISYYHRMIHETQKRLADAKKAKMDDGVKKIAQQIQKEANETVKEIFGLDTKPLDAAEGCDRCSDLGDEFLSMNSPMIKREREISRLRTDGEGVFWLDKKPQEGAVPVIDGHTHPPRHGCLGPTNKDDADETQ